MCSCGQPIAVSTSAHNQFAYQAEPVRCHACAAQQRAMKAFTDEGGDAAGLMSRWIRTPDPE